jgi:cytosine/adenosine deaminase-related metal-dependent hydrolase
VPVRPLTDLLDAADASPNDTDGSGASPSGALEGVGAALPMAPALRRYVVSADVVYDGLGTPRAGAAVVIQRVGDASNLVSVGSQADLRNENATAKPVDAGAALTPTLVNAHTHLDLSDMPFTPGGYVDFISAVIDHGRAGLRGVGAARRGVAKLLSCGTTVIGDVVARAEVMDYLLAQDDVRGVAYWEVLGPDPAKAQEDFDRVTQTVNSFRERQRPGGMVVGITPHTPHTVSAELLVRVTRWAQAEGLPVAIHVGESPAETRLHRHGDGELAETLRAVGVPFESRGISPVAYLDQLGVLAFAPTLIHMVEVDEDDVRAVQRNGCTVVHCPRSNTALDCGRFPWELYAKHGVDMAFGTDSLGSSPDLDVTAEVWYAAGLHGSKANVRGLVRAAVKGGHKALGMQPPRVTRGGHAGALYAWGRPASLSNTRHEERA